MGIDQQLSTPALAARLWLGSQRGSSVILRVTASSPNQAAAPQVPMVGPITRPSVAARYSVGSEGPTPECKVRDTGSSRSTDGTMVGSYRSIVSQIAVSTSRSGAARAIM